MTLMDSASPDHVSWRVVATGPGGKGDEARALLLSVDRLAALAETEEQIRRRLLEITPTDSQELAAAWQVTVEGHLAALSGPPLAPAFCCLAQFLFLVTCRMRNSRWNCCYGWAA
jgi:hypothetical protein